ncbi:MAG: hypothetical protein R2745_26425 [Vicinamibacterales bacterium]
MKSVIGYVVVALLLVAGGRVLFGASSLEDRTADAQQALLTLRYGDLETSYEALRAEASDGALLPRVSQALVSSLREQQSTTRYWMGTYGRLVPERDAAGALAESDPVVLELGAHAAYRSAQHEADQAAAVKRIDDIVRGYADVLRARPGDEDAAWNFEFVSRVRATIQQSRQPVMPEPEPSGLAGDLPIGPTLHGEPGAPPEGSDMKQFKVVVPMRPDERKQLPQGASEGEQRKRKG